MKQKNTGIFDSKLKTYEITIKNEMYTNIIFTKLFIPPEVYIQNPAEKIIFNPEKFDVYSMGITFLLAVTGAEIKDFIYKRNQLSTKKYDEFLGQQIKTIQD